MPSLPYSKPPARKSLPAVAAYGRVYRTPQAAQSDFIGGKDFLIVGGPYFSIRDLERLKQDGYTEVLIAVDGGVFAMAFAGLPHV